MSLPGTNVEEIVSTVVDLVRDHFSQKGVELSAEQCERIAGGIIYENFPIWLEGKGDSYLQRLFEPVRCVEEVASL